MGMSGDSGGVFSEKRVCVGGGVWVCVCSAVGR